MDSTALLIKEAFEKLTPYIERHTQRVCPDCRKVCCANKHGTPEAEDLLLFSALEIEPVSASGPPDALCSHLTPKGCPLPRWHRPFRCKWYFCGPLLESMQEEGGRDYRAFVGDLERLVTLRRELLGNLGEKK